MKKVIAGLLILVSPLVTAAAAEPGAPQSRFAQLENLKVHYTNYGEGPTAVVFVHGWSCDETVWTQQAPALSKQNVRAITIDLPGHGKSDKPQIAYSMDLYARAIDAVLQDAQLEKATLVGHSLGAASIRQFYRRFPHKVNALVVVDGALRPLRDAAMVERFIAPLRGPDFQHAAGRSIDGMTQKMSDSSMREAIKAMVLRTPQHVAVSEIESTLDPALWKPDEITVPVLMILAQGPLWTADYERFVRSFIPQLDYETWENVSHFLMMEKPRRFNDAVLAFMRKHLLLPERS